MRSRGRKLHTDIIEVYGGMYLALKDRIDGGEFVPECLVKTLIDTREKEKLDWVDTCMLAAVFTLGGVHSVCHVKYMTYHTQRSTDVWNDSMVPRAVALSPRDSGPCTRRA